MAFLQAVFSYTSPVGEREVRALDDVRAVYGFRLVSFDEGKRQLFIEYDASRLTPGDVAFMLGNAGICLEKPVAKQPD